MMRELSRFYLPILGIVIIFSGFWYVKAYFGFFAINEVIPTLSLDYIAQFSFAVIHELLTFKNVSRSVQFVLLMVFLVVLAYLVPNWSIRWPKAQNLWGVNSIPIAPFWIRVLLAAGVSFVWIFHVTHQIGITHACRFLQGRIPLTTTVDSVSSKEDYFAFYDAFGYRPNNNEAPPQITEVWRNSDFVYMTKRAANCNAERIVLKMPADQFRIIRLNLKPK